MARARRPAAARRARVTFRTSPAPGFDGIVRCQVPEIDPPERMVWSWAGGPIETTVTFSSRRGGGPGITLVTWLPELRPGSLTGLVLSCDDVDGACADLRERGVGFSAAPEDMPWGRLASLQDPDGNTWLERQPPAH